MLTPFVLITIALVASAQFSNPPPNRVAWKVGEVQNIKFNTTFTTFSVALWQQAPGGGSATLGPIVFETTNDAAAEFDWLVQTYSFDLDTSNVFFFWMFEGATSLQGNQSSPQMSSPFFTITNDTAVSSSSALTATTSSAITLTTSRALVPETSSSSSLSSSSSSPTYSPTYDSQQNSNGSNFGSLSAGARAGIGVSATIAGLGIACVAIYVRHLRKQQSQVARLNDHSPPLPYEQSQSKATPVEMATAHSPRLAELG
ncbi:hypothetical protein GGR53DRAFT_71039 [Hypoxylon sp. FL1150]|nr:hypothetical protein GGR53DRAFT_71039 [Hypoxylon sp. FL1150]